MEGEMDFDPTAEEGIVDINDEEYDSLIPDNDVDPQEFDNTLRRRVGKGWRTLKAGLNRMWQSRNPDRQVPEYLQLQTFDTPEENEIRDPVDAVKERLSELYENFNFHEVKLSEKDGDVYIQLKNQRQPGKWTKPEKLLTEEGEFRDRVSNLRGFQIASRGLLGRLEEVNARAAKGRAEDLEQTIEEMHTALNNKEEQLDEFKETLDEREREYQRQNTLMLDGHKRELEDLRERIKGAVDERDKARRVYDLAREELGAARTEGDRLKAEREELLREIRAKEEHLRQREQAIEDLERQAAEQREILNDSARSEEERAAAEREVEALQKRVTEL